ncbi:MAG: ATP-binding protein [Chlorobi bacterium]|nr:ATP-binding protein [Chlorobiota bacterium]
MERLYEVFDIKLRGTTLDFKRFLFDRIDWKNRLISILGARGTGKTTLVLQHIKEQFGAPSKDVLYADVNHVYFSQNTLIDLADSFYKAGGKYLFLDEIHKYRNWSVEIKQIHDTYKELHLVISGSSILEIMKGEADLSRRIVSYIMPGLSFREFIELDKGLKFDSFRLDVLLTDHMRIAHSITETIRPLEYFSDYLQYGYYPFFNEGKERYPEKLLNTINLILEMDLPAVEKIDYNNIQKLKTLLSVIAESAPFKPNTQKLADLIGSTRPTIIKFFSLLAKAQLLLLLKSATKGIRKLGKPDKIYLNNPNLMFALSPESPNKGTLRETFFFNQIKTNHTVELPKSGDFLVDNKYLFEVGGKTKGQKQIAGIENSWLVKDDMETGSGNVMPLWVFGFLY